MAAKKKRKRKSPARKKKLQKDFAGFYQEIAVLVSLAVCLFLELSNFGICGIIGNSVSGFLFGIFGMIQFVGPLIAFFVLILLISNHYSSLAIKKAFFTMLLYCMLAALFQMVITTDISNMKEVFLYSSVNKAGGGVVGGFIIKLLVKELGLAGSYVLILFISLISMVLITEKSLLSFLKKLKPDQKVKVQKVKVQKTKEGKQKVQEKEEKKEPSQPKPVPGRNKRGSILKDALTLASTKASEISKKTLDSKVDNQPIIDEIPEEIESKQIQTEEDLDRLLAQGSDGNALETEAPEEVEAVKEEPKKRPQRKSFVNKEESVPVLDVAPIESTGMVMKQYIFPSLNLLKKGKAKSGDNQTELKKTALKLQQTLGNFGVNVTITDINQGPSVTRFELQPEQGVKVSKIVGLTDDIKLNLAASDIRIEAPIPGKAAVGIEVPNKTNEVVMFRDLIENNEFKRFKSKIAFAVGKNLSGRVIVSDIAKMPHLLIAGATGSGKSVCINTLIMSILYKAHPDDVKLIMIDPKVVELSAYQGIPHLLIPVVTDPKQASSALNWAVMEMGDRYKKFAEVNVRNLEGYNQKVEEMKKQGLEGEDFTKLPQLVIIIDELADLMMVAPSEVEDAIVRLSQLARAAGIHLIIATQRPSVNVITGLIKANVPSRIAFSVSSGVDSRTIIDMNGAEKLLGKGDMLFYPAGYQKPVRIQGAFVSDEEVAKVVEFLKSQNLEGDDGAEIKEKIQSAVVKANHSSERDEYFEDAATFVIDKQKATIGSLQRMFKIGFNRAARIMDQLCDAGIVGEEGTKPRKVLMSEEQFEQFKEEYL
ncbi:MAG: DNA translocase FtsK 4TM domain-containing protein [Anaerostipes sp.]|nr:DNA translocase FtsK 4TM domain-containing protein [Anaerostipes sp.]